MPMCKRSVFHGARESAPYADFNYLAAFLAQGSKIGVTLEEGGRIG